MICRLKVDGIKNLVDAEIRLGPLVCFAGPNGAGKSNVLDVLALLGSLSSSAKEGSFYTLRQHVIGRAEYRDLFTSVGDGNALGDATIEVDFILPESIPGEWLTQAGAILQGPEPYSPPHRFLRYRIGFRYDPAIEGDKPIHIVDELLESLYFDTVEDALKNDGGRQVAETLYRRTPTRGGSQVSVRPSVLSFPLWETIQGWTEMAPLPPSSVSAFSWLRGVSLLCAAIDVYWGTLSLYHFEPSKLREPSNLGVQSRLSPSGGNLPAFLARVNAEDAGGEVYPQISRRVAALVDDVKEIWVEKDEVRELQLLKTRSPSGAVHDARALSDGTLRLVAYAALELGRDRGTFLLEQPEDGIHPRRLPAVASLLKGMAWDPEYPEGDDNPLRQVIFTTHSPALVAQIPDDSLIFVTSVSSLRNGQKFYRARFKVLPDTWRTGSEGTPSDFISRGELYSYLNPLPDLDEGDVGHRLIETLDQ